jgi:hypothetical protein
MLAQTIISTPTKNYTVLEQKQLMLDMGDIGGVSNWQVHQTVCMYKEQTAKQRES